MRSCYPIGLVAIVALLVGGWGWPWKYGSKFEAQKACADWVSVGPKKYVSGWLYEIRLKDTNVSYSDYGLNLPQGGPKPGEWSPTFSVKKKSDIPKPLPNEEVKSWSWSNTVSIRSCIHEPVTHQFLGTEKSSISKRFKY